MRYRDWVLLRHIHGFPSGQLEAEFTDRPCRVHWLPLVELRSGDLDGICTDFMQYFYGAYFSCRWPRGNGLICLTHHMNIALNCSSSTNMLDPSRCIKEEENNSVSKSRGQEVGNITSLLGEALCHVTGIHLPK